MASAVADRTYVRDELVEFGGSRTCDNESYARKEAPRYVNTPMQYVASHDRLRTCRDEGWQALLRAWSEERRNAASQFHVRETSWCCVIIKFAWIGCYAFLRSCVGREVVEA